ncbi:NUDIX hydrolase, partial [Frankia sp. EI5c]|uniref:NUDIX hydrolase n=1 Tax=Frankia sp. EI5c TaxID=683316 RepID=UPI001F5BA2D3
MNGEQAASREQEADREQTADREQAAERQPERGGAPVRAAGGVVWRPAAEEVEIVLVHRPRHEDWSLPKGKLDDGETWLAAAVREIEEETGFAVEVGEPLGDVTYLVDHHGS